MSSIETARDAHPPLRWALLLFLAFLTLSNGVLMILFSEQWYLCLITPERASLFNPHFVIDVGGAYVTMGVALLWAALRPVWAFPLISVALLFSLLHGGNHVYEYLSFGNPTRYLAVEVFGIWAPLLLLAGLAVVTRPREEGISGGGRG
jgi:hypothetical protein